MSQYSHSHSGPFFLPPALPPAPPRISGTAMPNGVFLSTGTASTASPLGLFLTGLSIVLLGVSSLIPTYALAWAINDQLGPHRLGLVSMLLGVGGPADPVLWGIGRVGLNVLTLFVFLTLLRLSPLSGYHAAEHMTVHAIEHYGVYGWENRVADMPRAHLRCGSNLLAGILPTMLVALPLLQVFWPAALVVAAVGWRLRFRLGYFIQNVFTTRQPSPLQLERGIASGRRVLDQWLQDPSPRLPLARRLWLRGLPQMVAGVLCAMFILEFVAARLHLWLDW